MGHFLSDLDRSQGAVVALTEHFESLGFEVRPLPREEQIKGDLELKGSSGIKNVEIKYDIMAARTGNLCFETSNGTKMTGIYKTEADFICYVVPRKDGKEVYVFNPTSLRKYVETSPNVKIKNGGDKRKFILALVKLTDVIEDELISEQLFLKN
jgi:hypothetical protein